jgi:hypothetical protein
MDEGKDCLTSFNPDARDERGLGKLKGLPRSLIDLINWLDFV